MTYVAQEVLSAGRIHHVMQSFSAQKAQKNTTYLNWIQEGFKGGFSAKVPQPDSGPFSGRFGSDSGGLPHCNSDFWPVTPIFGL